MVDNAASTELATVAAPPKAGAIEVGDKGLVLRTFDDMFRFAQALVKAGLAPKGLETPEKAFIAIQAGMELGFSPMRALAAVTVINGRAGLMGEAVCALIHDRGVCSRPPVLTVEGDGDARAGVCRFQRKDMPEPAETRFSVAEAKRAQLWGKTSRSGEPSAWVTYPDDMLQWRALARASKRYFGDVTLGLVVAEELADYPATAVQRSVTPPREPDPLLALMGGMTAAQARPQAVEDGTVTRVDPVQQPPVDRAEPVEAEVIDRPEPEDAVLESQLADSVEMTRLADGIVADINLTRTAKALYVIWIREKTVAAIERLKDADADMLLLKVHRAYATRKEVLEGS